MFAATSGGGRRGSLDGKSARVYASEEQTQLTEEEDGDEFAKKSPRKKLEHKKSRSSHSDLGLTGSHLGKTKQLYSRISRSYDCVMFCAVFACLFMMVEVESVTRAIMATADTIGQPSGDGSGEVITNVSGLVTNTSLQVALKIAVMIFILGEVTFLCVHHHLVTELMRMQSGEVSVQTARWSRTTHLLLEIVLCSIHTPFFVDSNTTMLSFRTAGGYDGPWEYDAEKDKIAVPYHADMLSMVMFLRVYLIPRYVLYHSDLWPPSLASSTLGALAQVEVSVSMAVRKGFAQYGLAAIVFFLFFPFVSLSFIFSNCERFLSPMYAQHHHSAWANFISLSTVGYGTDEAQTQCGRCASILQILLGITGTSLLINEIQNRMHMPTQQQHVMRLMAETKREKDLRNLSAELIQNVWRTVQVQKQIARGNLHVMRDRHSQKFIASSSAVHPSGSSENPMRDAWARLKQVPAVYRSYTALKELKQAPLDFQTDFSTAIELEVHTLNTLMHELKSQQYTIASTMNASIKSAIREEMDDLKQLLLEGHSCHKCGSRCAIRPGVALIPANKGIKGIGRGEKARDNPMDLDEVERHVSSENNYAPFVTRGRKTNDKRRDDRHMSGASGSDRGGDDDSGREDNGGDGGSGERANIAPWIVAKAKYHGRRHRTRRHKSSSSNS